MSSLADIIASTAQRYGLDPGYVTRVGQIESSLNPKASNGSAAGLYQFIPSTAAHYGLSNPFDPVSATDAVARLTHDNATALTKALGRAPTNEELYLAHQQGAGGAAKLLTNPTAPAASLVGAHAVTANGGSADMTAGQFAQLWARKFDGAKAGASQLSAAVGAPGSLPNIPTASAPIPATLDTSVFIPNGPAATPDDSAEQAAAQAVQARRMALLQSAQGLFAR